MKAAVVMGSISDFDIVQNAVKTLKAFDIEVCVRVISAHRTPNEAYEFAATAQQDGIEVIIAAAGKAAHLAGVIASYTVLPVIGLPIKSSALAGLDSLLSIVQMPAGVPVATVAINGAENAALLAVQMLSLKYPDLKIKLAKHRLDMQNKVLESNLKLQKEINI